MFLNYLGALPGAICQGIIWGIMAIGVYITFKVLDLADLTVDGSICTGACVCVMAMLNGIHFALAMLLAFLAGIICGLVTGIFHTLLGIPAILAGILTQLGLWSINLKILGRASQTLAISPEDIARICIWDKDGRLVNQLNIYQSLWILFILAAVIIAILYGFFGTELGSAIRATGNNLRMASAQGINTNLMKILGLMLSNGIVALAGALLCQYQGFGEINMGRGAIVIGLAAVIIGEAVISKISQNFAVRLTGVIVGGIIYYIVYQTVIFLGLDPDLLKLLSAIVVAIFLGLPYLKNKYFSKKTVVKGQGA